MRDSDARKIETGSQPLTEGYQPVEVKGYQPRARTHDGYQPSAAEALLRPLKLGGSSVIAPGASYSGATPVNPPPIPVVKP